MILFFCLTLLGDFLFFPANAAIFKSEDDLNNSWERARPLQKQIYPGKIIVGDSSNQANWLDYASAFPIGKPGDKQTNVVVSAAHTYLTSTDYSSHRYYCDSLGNRCEIDQVFLPNAEENLIKAKESIKYAENDIVIYRLKKPTACNPLNDIPKHTQEYADLATLTYGWAVYDIENKGVVQNLNGSHSYSFQNSFEYIGDSLNFSRNTYIYRANSDRSIVLSDCVDSNKFKAVYLASTVKTESTPQIYYHDSGAPWFAKNADGGYSLNALTSRMAPVVYGAEISPFNGLLGKTRFDWQADQSYELIFMGLQQKCIAQTTLTSLATHRDWILKHCF